MPDKNEKSEKGYWDSFVDWVGEKYDDSRRYLCEKDMMHGWGEWEYIRKQSCKQIKTCEICGKQKMRMAAHDWDTWDYVKHDSCEQKRKCKRCGHTDSKIAIHQYGDEKYKSANSCEKEKACLRCNHKMPTRVVHNYGKWGPSEQKKTKVFYANRIREVYQILKKYSRDDIKNLCRYLHIDFENLKGENKAGKITDLISSCIINRRLDELLDGIPTIIHDLSEKGLRRLAEIKIDIATKEQFVESLNFLWDFDPRLSCHKDRKCRRCNHIESKEEHIFGRQEYVSENSCLVVKYCHACGKSSGATQGNHDWGEWKYTYPNKCDMYRKCERCKKAEKRGGVIEHVWVKEPDPVNPCLIVNYCTRCRTKGKIQGTKHNWVLHPQNANSCKKQKYCTVCNKVELIKYAHVWDPYKPKYGQGGQVIGQVRKCRFCGELDSREDKS